MAATMLRATWLLALSGCGQLLGIGDLRATPRDGGGDVDARDATGDASVDASADASVDAMMGVSTITGKVRRIDGFGGGGGVTAEHNAPVAFARLPENTEVSRSTTDGQGAYVLAAPSLGLDGYVTAGPITDPSHATRRYLVHPLTPNVTLDIELYTAPAIAALASGQFGLQQNGNKGFVAIVVLDAGGQPAAGVALRVPATAGVVRYNNSAAQGATSADGVAFLFNVNAGSFLLEGIQNGATFASRQIELPPETNGQVTLQDASAP